MPHLLWFTAKAQDINFRALNGKDNHIISGYFGADYSSYYGLSYAYVLTAEKPIVIGTEFTLPFGDEVLDDWKWKTGAQMELWKNESFSFALKPSIIWRRYESPLARFYNFGADVSVIAGYSKAKWGASIIFNMDRNFSTHIKHGSLKESYPEIRDGWYGASGGNFKSGLRINGAFKSWNLFLTVGKHYGQNFKDNPTLPFFAEFSLQKQWGYKK